MMRKCPRCDCPNPENRAHCYQCNTPLGDSPPPPPTPVSTQEPEATPDTVPVLQIKARPIAIILVCLVVLVWSVAQMISGYSTAPSAETRARPTPAAMPSPEAQPRPTPSTVPAPETRVGPTETQTPATPARPAAPAAQFRRVGGWSGTGTKTTEPFRVNSSPWVVKWSASAGGCLSVWVQDNAGNPISEAASTEDGGSDQSYVYTTGTLHLNILAANCQWAVEVWAKQ